ncbi:DEAD/DEAH box helicase [Agromyces archimandritae]|uniref:DEAD/DEAH box helicase n=1 Tax=Agromyces archimandritae TaxID=2781962 RepID=A0A975IPJ0_9MICO|nr:DEAD/DEAH box helicase [Agromyces archimandritae]QTX05693.1 DEAD/DEAH box helicase [Agromyces archimandritae]
MSPGGWRRELEVLRAGGAPGGAWPERRGADAGAPRHPLALQFELRQRLPRRPGAWQGPRDQPALRDAAVDRLAVRPVTRGAKGAWIKGQLSWQNIAYRADGGGYDPAQSRWFAQFALLNGRNPAVYQAYGSEWITLDEFESPLLWGLLAEAGRLGIALTGAAATPGIHLRQAASVAMDAASDSDGGLALVPAVAVDGSAREPRRTRLIGDHGVYVFDFETGAIELAPLARRASDAVRGLLAAPAAIRVPPEEVPEFLAAHYRPLAREIEVGSADGSFAPPEPDEHELADDGTGGTGPGGTGDAVGHAADEDGWRRIDEPPELTVTTVPTEKNDWFELGVIVTVAGKKVPFLPLYRALSAGAKRLRLIDRSYLPLNLPVFDRLRELIAEAGTLAEWEAGVRIHRSRVSLWSDFEDLADIARPAVEWRQAVEALEPGGAPELPQPAGVVLPLRHYQLEGFRWLAYLWRAGLGGILADDMGLGKTAQTLALVAHAAEAGAGPFLVVAPTSVAANWAAEAARFTPGLRVASVTRTAAKRGQSIADAAAAADLVITTYAVLRLEADAFGALEWGGLVLDEAQFVKNPATRAHEAARGIRTRFRLAVTGTPVENHVGEPWSILAIVAPGLFPSQRAFTVQYRRPIEHGHETRLEQLRRRVRPLMLRRTKDVVAPELPEKQEQVLSVELHPKHRRLYDVTLQRERQKLLDLLDADEQRSRFIVYRSLTLLRLLALDAALVDERHAGIPSAKLDALFAQLDEVAGAGHRVLVFSQFTSFLARVAARMDAEGTPYAYLDGSTPTRRRTEEVARFRAGEVPVFLISLKAGGFGLNLTEADYVYLLDPWWNPASEAQAVDRAHRIGQERPVNVYRLVAEGTIEERVMTLKRRKGELVDALMGDEGFADAALTADELRALLE